MRQLEALSDLFERALDLCTPESVAVVGVAADSDTGPYQRIELCCADLTDLPLSLVPVELVHAALVFEHTGLGRCLENALLLVAPGGKLSVVLQLPSEAEQGVTPTRYSSMQALRDFFALIDISHFRLKLEEKGFHLFHEERRSLPAGKAFWLGIFAHGTE